MTDYANAKNLKCKTCGLPFCDADGRECDCRNYEEGLVECPDCGELVRAESENLLKKYGCLEHTEGAALQEHARYYAGALAEYRKRFDRSDRDDSLWRACHAALGYLDGMPCPSGNLGANLSALGRWKKVRATLELALNNSPRRAHTAYEWQMRRAREFQAEKNALQAQLKIALDALNLAEELMREARAERDAYLIALKKGGKV